MRWLCVVPFMLLSGAAFAQQGLQAQVYACAKIEDATQRHACFDGLVPELRKADGSVSVATPAPAATARSPLTAPVLSTAEARAAKEAKREVEVDKIRLNVTRIEPGRDGKYRFTLENGQVWRQLDTIRFRNLGDGPWAAEVRKAALGSYLLAVDKQAAVRVERVN